MIEGRVIVIGGGGHGRVVIDALRSSGAEIQGVLDPSIETGNELLGVPVLGGDEWLERDAAAGSRLVVGVGAVPFSDLRRKVYVRLRADGWEFPPVVHSSSILGDEVSLSRGSQVMAGSVIQCGVEIGENSVVNTRASLDHDCVIGRHVFIAPGAVLCGQVRVESDAFVGAGAVVLPGIKLGEGCVVGAGAVVTRNVTARMLVVGNPATEKARA